MCKGTGVWPLALLLSSVGKSMKRVRKRAPLGHSTSAQISTVLSPPFFLCSIRWDQKAQMCHILRTYSGSSHTNNHRIPKGQVMLATLNTSQKYLTNERIRPHKCYDYCIMTNKTWIKKGCSMIHIYHMDMLSNQNVQYGWLKWP